MASSTPTRTHPVGESHFRRLVTIHDGLREDLAALQQMARALVAEPAPDTTGARLRLRAGCLAYTAIIHDHHTVEDVVLFPAVRRSNRALGEEIERLEEDHDQLVASVHEVDEATAGLVAEDSPAARERAAAALERLGRDLLAHLEREEETLGPTMRSWRRHP